MATKYYSKNIQELQEYFGVSEICAKYLYHRSYRSKRISDGYIPWDIKMQNALVKADKCLGIDWSKITFGNEEFELIEHGIFVSEQPNCVFRWSSSVEQSDDLDEWTVVQRKKAKPKFTNAGIIV